MSKTSCALRRSRGSVHKAVRAPAECEGVGRGVSNIIMHKRAGERLRATAACAVRVGVPRHCNRSALPQARPTPRTLSARARRCTPLERGVMTRHDDLNVAS